MKHRRLRVVVDTKTSFLSNSIAFGFRLAFGSLHSLLPEQGTSSKRVVSSPSSSAVHRLLSTSYGVQCFDLEEACLDSRRQYLPLSHCHAVESLFNNTLQSSSQESTDALVAPLLHSDEEGGEETQYLQESFAMSSSSTSTTMDPRLMSLPPLMRGVVLRCLRIKTASDVLPSLFFLLVTNGKSAAMGLVGVYLVFLSCWLPFWLLSFVVTEWGIYVLAVATVFLVGRSIIRMIAFPGASRRVTGDIETEFARYSVRMLLAATDSLKEVITVLSPKDTTEAQRLARFGPDVPGMWRHARMYRDRVFGVYVDVLFNLYQQAPVPSHGTQSDLTKYGNNRMNGDIGDLSGLTPQARADGHALLERMAKILTMLDDFERLSGNVLEGASPLASLGEESKALGSNLVSTLTEFRDFVISLSPPRSPQSRTDQSSDDEEPADSLRRRIDEETSGGSVLDTVTTGLNSILPMLDPPPHTSIFGLDCQRGCTISRYRGARQFWVRRPTGGMIDVLHFPALGFNSSGTRNTKAVLYCNPNAGLVEVAAGMSLVGGNVPAAENSSTSHESWIDFYTGELGLDCYVFNYAGYGRSHGSTLCVSGKKADEVYHAGFFARLGRIFRSTFLAFQPTSDTLRADGVAVGEHLVKELGIKNLVIHGESIGGVAASGTGRYLSHHPATRNQLALLICDRTFCNLEAVAQRLVGGWSGYAIRALAPLWNTDVTGDFLAASCRKVVAIDAADTMIADSASLKAGIALWKELHRGVGTAKGLGWLTEEPLQYRMADWENVCVNDSRYVASTKLIRAQAPVWPSDKYITVEEAFHFAACCKRIGKIAKENATMVGVDVDGEGVPQLSTDVLSRAWLVLACCDGLTGATLGVAVKRGFDATVAWLCSCLVFGGQALVATANRQSGRLVGDFSAIEISLSDFDNRPVGFEREESSVKIFPKPIPEVIETLAAVVEQGEEAIARLSHEFVFVIGMLQYIQTRLSAQQSVETSYKQLHLQTSETSSSDIGSFLNLTCGHNNAFKKDEKARLAELIHLAVPPDPQP